MIERGKKNTKLILTGILLLLVFTYPFLSIGNQYSYSDKIPRLYKYIFICWSVGVVLLFIITETKPGRTNDLYKNSDES